MNHHVSTFALCQARAPAPGDRRRTKTWKIFEPLWIPKFNVVLDNRGCGLKTSVARRSVNIEFGGYKGGCQVFIFSCVYRRVVLFCCLWRLLAFDLRCHLMVLSHMALSHMLLGERPGVASYFHASIFVLCSIWPGRPLCRAWSRWRLGGRAWTPRRSASPRRGSWSTA